jgi:ppGpp synthetase/RelA/SpoT-type nucleotidyltranferase
MVTPDSANQPFDFGSHARIAVEQYQRRRPLYSDFTAAIEGILEEALASRNIKVASVEGRAKSIESFARKASEPSPLDPNTPKYKDPLAEITDLAGARIVAFFPRTVGEVNQLINQEFVVLERSDKADVLKQEERLGYQSVHYLVALKPSRTSLPEYRRFKELSAEIQVRTILQHAWAEIEHDIQYKSIQTIPSSIRRRFMALAGLFEIADREFQAIQDEDERVRQAARESVLKGTLEAVEITADALKAYLDKKLGPDARMTSFSYDWTAKMLIDMGFSNFNQIDKTVEGYDDDQLSRIAFGTRQGQLMRFETQLLAAMGEFFIARHPFSQHNWFVGASHARLERLKQAGIAIRNSGPHGGVVGQPEAKEMA